jgi:long-chain acyl-CoA synthetase
MTPIEALDYQAKTRPNDTALISGEDVWTYQRLAAEVDRLARGLTVRGIQPGDRIALHMANVPQLIVAYQACFSIGAIAAPLNTRFKAAELNSLLQRLQPALYIGQAALYREVSATDPSILPSDARFIVGEAAGLAGARCCSELFANIGCARIATAADIDVPAILLTTSGTTGQPKFVAHSQASMSATTEALKALSPSGDEIAIMMVPMVHAGGLAALFKYIRCGAPIVLLERFDPNAVLDAIERFQATEMLGMPFMFAALVNSQRKQGRNVSSLRTCISAGDVCPLQLQESFLEVFDRPLRNFWGMSETIGCLAYGPQPGPVCRVADGAQVSLVDRNGIPVQQGHLGELVLRGPNVAIGYWLGPNRTESALHNGWFHTGDLMWQDEKGDLWFVARKKELIVRGGSNISSAEVEHVLTAHPAVQDAAVVGVPDDELGQRVVGFVQLADEMRSQIAQQILAEVSHQIAGYKLPERLTIVGEIPRNALGKIDRKALLATIS